MTNEGAGDVESAAPLTVWCSGCCMGRSASGVGGETHLCPHQRSHSEQKNTLWPGTKHTLASKRRVCSQHQFHTHTPGLLTSSREHEEEAEGQMGSAV